MDIAALTFDVFGTVVDWRGSIIREGERIGRAKAIAVDWPAFADAWRGLYQPAMSQIRDGKIGWLKLDELHRQNLEQVLRQFSLQDSFDDAERGHLNKAWHRLSPWPDSVPGMTRLRRRFTLASLSNGNMALIVNMARQAGIPWDIILGAEVARHYKPQAETYLNAAEMLDLAPAQCLMVAAHNSDLVAAAAVGFKTAFIHRPAEYGPNQTIDLAPEHDFDFVARDILDLANQMGC